MIEVMKAIRSKALADVTLVGASMLNGNHVYREMPDITTEQLPALIVVRCAVESEDKEVPYATEIYEAAITARSVELADSIAERWVALFKWQHGVAGSGALGAITGRRLAEPITFEPAPPPLSSDDGSVKLYTRFRQMRVATYAA